MRDSSTRKQPVRTTVELPLRVAPEVRAKALEDARQSTSVSQYVSELIMRPRRRLMPFAPGMELRDLVDIGRRVTTALDVASADSATLLHAARTALAEAQHAAARAQARLERAGDDDGDLRNILVSLISACQAALVALTALPAGAQLERSILGDLRRAITQALVDNRTAFDVDMNRREDGASSAWQG